MVLTEARTIDAAPHDRVRPTLVGYGAPKKGFPVLGTKFVQTGCNFWHRHSTQWPMCTAVAEPLALSGRDLYHFVCKFTFKLFVRFVPSRL